MDDFGPVILDTDVWSLLTAGRKERRPEIGAWRRALEGRPLYISAQTRGEVLFGALKAGWGAQRTALLRSSLAAIGILYPTREIVDAWASIRAECEVTGHPLADKVHMGDAWIAATAVALDMPLLSRDGIFAGVGELQLLQWRDR